MDMKFEWDNSKAITNLKKHGVSFEEAQTVFDNPLAVIFDDAAHSINEYREIIIGHSLRSQLLIISFTERSNSIRIISARPATRKEREEYERNSL
ncbi:BrnT family toxin [Pseudanabaena biceps]|nr:BrnT family toxin [Pseudanabaena biceps]